MPTLPPVVVELKASLSELKAGMSEAGTELDNLEAHSATTGEKVQAGLSKGFMVAGAAATGIGAALTEISEKAESGRKELEVAIGNTGASFEEYGTQIDAAITHEEKYGRTAGETQEALAKLTTATQNPAKALQDLNLVTEIATVKHISLSAAADLVNKAHAGSTRVFKEFGIELSKNKNGTVDVNAALDELSRRLNGQADAAADTFGGKLAMVRAKVEDFAGSMGHTLGPALTVAGPLLMGIGAIIESSVVPAIISATVAAAPWILAIAAIGAAAYEIYSHWGAIWGGIQQVFSDVWHSMYDTAESVWGGLNAIFTKIYDGLGPISDALHVLRDVWKATWDELLTILKVAWDLITGAFKVYADVISTAFKVLVDLLTGQWGKMWDDIKNGVGKIFVDLGNTIRKAFGDMLNGLGGLAKDLLAFGEDLGQAIVDGIISFIKSAPSLLGDAIKSVVPGGSTVVNLIDKIPGIPHLASGGIVNSPTVALIGESGPEAVVPLSQAQQQQPQGPVYIVLDGQIVGKMLQGALLRQGRNTASVGLA